jgi:hypothetical protein
VVGVFVGVVAVVLVGVGVVEVLGVAGAGGPPPAARTAAAASGRAAPPLSSNGPAPNAITSEAVMPIAIATRFLWGRGGRLRARRDAGAGGELTRGTVLAAVPCGGARRGGGRDTATG